MKELFNGLGTTAKIISLFAIITGAVSFILQIVEIADGRKRLLKFRTKSVKVFFVYTTLILSVLTLLLQSKEESDKNLAELKYQHTEDSIRDNYKDITLQAIKKTVDSTDTVLT